jgi:hypothetical protein
MKQTIIIRVVAAVVVVVFVVGTWAQTGRPDLGWLKYFSAAVLASTIILGLFDLWIWRLSIVQKLPNVPRSVRGTWKGTLTSFWIDPATNARPQPKPVYLVVHQTATTVSVKLFTDESRSASELGKVSAVDNSFVLSYLYLNRPDLRFEHRSRIHHGSVVLDISGRPARRLQGRYWTDRDSKGELDFVEWNKELADDFVDAAALFNEET